MTTDDQHIPITTTTNKYQSITSAFVIFTAMIKQQKLQNLTLFLLHIAKCDFCFSFQYHLKSTQEFLKTIF